MISIYLASSRNETMIEVLQALRNAKFTVYSPHELGNTWPAELTKNKPILYKTNIQVIRKFSLNLQRLYASHAVVGCMPLDIDAAIMFGIACQAKPDATYSLLSSRSKPVLAYTASAYHTTTVDILIAKLLQDFNDN